MNVDWMDTSLTIGCVQQIPIMSDEMAIQSNYQATVFRRMETGFFFFTS